MEQVFVEFTTYQKRLDLQIASFIRTWKLKNQNKKLKLVAIHEFNKIFLIKPINRSYQLCVFETDSTDLYDIKLKQKRQGAKT